MSTTHGRANANAPTITYALRTMTGDILNLANIPYGMSAIDENIRVFGSPGEDRIYVGPGLRLDLTDLGLGNDRIYFTGALNDYTQSIDQDTAIYTFTHKTRPTEVVRVQSMGQNDVLYFADGHFVFNANNDPRLYNVNTWESFAITGAMLEAGGTPVPQSDATVTIHGISDDTGASGADYITNDNNGLTISASLSRPLESLQSQGSVGAALPMRVFIRGTDGADIPYLGLSGQSMVVVGSSGADNIYVGLGVAVDAAVLGQGNDAVYFTGNLADYTQSIDQDTGIYTFRHSVRTSEVVRLTSMGEDDVLYFADGHIVFNANSDARLYNQGTGQFVAVDTSWLSAGGSPLIVEKLQYSNDGGTTWQDVNHAIGLDDTSITLNDPTLTSSANVQFRVINQASSGVVSAQQITIDIAPPEAPVITGFLDDVGSQTGLVAAGGVSDDLTPQISGTAEAGSRVRVSSFSGLGVELLVGETTADASGNWGLTSNSLHADDWNNIFAYAVDAAGNQSGRSNNFNVNVSVAPPAPPAAPVITGFYDDVANQIGVDLTGYPAEALSLITAFYAAVPNQIGWVGAGGYSNDLAPQIRGTAEANMLVRLLSYNSGSVLQLGEVTADANGDWVLSSSNLSANDWNNIYAYAVAGGGNLSAASNNFNVYVDVAPPPAPVITAFFDNVEGVTGWVGAGGYSNDLAPEIYGTAEAGSRVRVLSYLPGWGAGSRLIGEAVVDGSGNWVIGASNLYANDWNNIVAFSIDVAGNLSGWSNIFNVLTDVAPPPAPVITGFLDNEGPAAWINSGGVTNDLTPEIHGSGVEAGSRVRVIGYNGVWQDGRVLGETTADALGNWGVYASNLHANDWNNIVAVSLDAAGNQSGNSNQFNVVVDVAAPPAPVITGFLDNEGPAEWINSGGATDDLTPEIHGSGAEAGSRVRVIGYNGVWQDGRVLGETTADALGNWGVYASNLHANDWNNIVAVSLDAAGNQSGNSNQFNVVVAASAPPPPVVVDVTPPPPPVITAFYDDVGAPSWVGSGGFTNDVAPEIYGTAEAGSVVRVYSFRPEWQGQRLIGETVADGNGNWGIHAPNLHANELNWLVATSTDAAGNGSTFSNRWDVRVDVAPPPPPVITGFFDSVGAPSWVGSGGYSNDVAPEMYGTAEAGSVVRVYSFRPEWQGERLVGETVADGNGNWGIHAPNLHANELNWLVATSTDAAGNGSTFSNRWDVWVDVAPPPAPVITGFYDNVGAPAWVGSGGYSNDLAPEIYGTAEAGSRVQVRSYLPGGGGERLLGETVADGNGNWGLHAPNLHANDWNTIIATSVDAAGNQSGGSNHFNVNTAPAPVIDLGSYGTLIHPVVVDGGQVYYFWDRSGDLAFGGGDATTHNELDLIFRYDFHGNLNPGVDTNDTYRFAVLDGVKVALPVYGGTVDSGGLANSFGLQQGTAVDNSPVGEVNPTYDGLLAIWDAYNIKSWEPSNGAPPGWGGAVSSHYAAATPSPNGHAYVHLGRGLTADTSDLFDLKYVALQVL